MKKIVVSGTCLAALGATLGACSSGLAARVSSANQAHVVSARAFIAPYLKAPTPFPVTTPLKHALSHSFKLAQPETGTTTGALIAQLTDAAAKAAGIQVFTANAGATPSSSQAAFQTLLAQHPKAIEISGLDPSFFTKPVKQARKEHIIVTSDAVMYPQRYGIQAGTYDQHTVALEGKILADWTVAKHGAKANVVFYVVPELSFTPIMYSAFRNEMKKQCSMCHVRKVVISVTQYATAPSKVVSDLQAHPGTNVVAFSAIEAAAGTPAALRGAGISKVDIIGQGTDPVSLGYLKNRQISAMIAFDAPTMAWTTVDEALRLAERQPLTPAERTGAVPIQLLEPNNVPANTSKGFVAYPNFAQRFAKLWRPAK